MVSKTTLLTLSVSVTDNHFISQRAALLNRFLSTRKLNSCHNIDSVLLFERP